MAVPSLQLRQQAPVGKEELTSIGDVRQVSGPFGRPRPSLAACRGVEQAMKSRNTLIRLKRFHVEEKRRRVQQIEAMTAEFVRMADELAREVAAEEARAGISDPNHFAYPTYAKAASQRRDNLLRSAEELRAQLEDARAELDEAIEELRKVELLDDREAVRESTREAVAHA